MGLELSEEDWEWESTDRLLVFTFSMITVYNEKDKEYGHPYHLIPHQLFSSVDFHLC